jgi:hypothetical protein
MDQFLCVKRIRQRCSNDISASVVRTFEPSCNSTEEPHGRTSPALQIPSGVDTIGRYQGIDMSARQAFLLFRFSKWLFSLATIALYVEYLLDTSRHVNSFGHLLPLTEILMFGLPLAAVFAGCFEMMMRERADIPRPTIGQIRFR